MISIGNSAYNKEKWMGPSVLTVSKIMEIDPKEGSYLAASSDRLRPIRKSDIQQRGQPVRSVRTDLALVEQISAQRGIRL